MKTDLMIAQEAEILPIERIAYKARINTDYLEYYGKYKAKVSLELMDSLENQQNGKLVLVTAINPTKAGEGKSTTTIGLVDGLAKLNKNVMGALREPSLGPVFGVKGGATGGGYSQVMPMEDINLHFTGDMHAITTANNLISAVIDNHLFQGNELNIDPNRIVWKRCLDMNDRALREVEVGKGNNNGIPRLDGFNITVATEIMAILCLSKTLIDFEERVNEIIVAYTSDNKIVTVRDLKIGGAVALVMKEAIKPNLVQTLEHNPVLIHGGPFANIAHGCNSIIATKMALRLADYVVTEAGFGADLGAEKFLDIKCRTAGLNPNAIVLVATIRALKLHGGVAYADLASEDVNAVKLGIENLQKHIETIETFGVPFVVTLNKFSVDTKEEIKFVQEWCEEREYSFAICEGWEHGGNGTIDLAEKVIEACEKKSNLSFLYELTDSIEEKIEKVVKKSYGGDTVVYSENAKEQLKLFKENGWDELPICMAKTPLSLSDNPKLKGRPRGFDIHVKELRISAGAKFIVVLTGDVMTMPGLPKIPAAEQMGIDEKGNAYGIF